MNTATHILRKEHDVILRMLDATERAAQLLDRAAPVAPETLNGLLEFFRLFADLCHHGKEEELLFPLLEKKGLPRGGGPIGVMRMEHDQGRSLIRRMAECAEAYGRGDAAAEVRWARAAREYTWLLREHIEKENEVLFRMAEDLLTEEEQQKLAGAFEKLEVEKMGAGTHERLHGLMDKLVAALSASDPAR